MADLDTLMAFLGGGSGSNVSDITGFQNQIAQNDLWKVAAAPVLQAKFDTSTWSPMQSFGVSAGQAFLGTLLNEIGNQSESRQLEKVASILPQLYKDPLNTATPEGVDPKAFATLKLNTATRADSARSAQLQKLLTEIMPNQAKDINSIEEKARDSLRTVPLVTNFQDVKTSFNTMLDTYALEGKPSTLAFVSSFARVLDPGSVVREGEIKNAENTQSFLNGLGYSLKSLVDGSQSISPETRQQMLQAASAKYNTFGGDFQKYLSSQQDLVERLGGRRGNVFAPTTFEPFDFNNWASKQSGGQSNANVISELTKIRDALKLVSTPEEKQILLQRAQKLTAAPTTPGGVPRG